MATHKQLPGGYTATRAGNPGCLRWDVRGPDRARIGSYPDMPAVHAAVKMALASAKLTPVSVEDAGRMLASVS